MPISTGIPFSFSVSMKMKGRFIVSVSVSLSEWDFVGAGRSESVLSVKRHFCVRSERVAPDDSPIFEKSAEEEKIPPVPIALMAFFIEPSYTESRLGMTAFIVLSP